MGKKGKHTADVRVSKATKKILKTAGYKVRNKPIEHKHYRKDAMLNLDYNLLENQYVVRKYFQRKYGISLRELELLLYLYPKGYFSHADYKEFPSSFSHRQIRVFIKRGFIQVFVEGPNYSKHVYSLTKSAQLIVMNYYKYLSGEKTISILKQNNPYMDEKDASSHDKKIANMFKILAKKNKAED